MTVILILMAAILGFAIVLLVVPPVLKVARAKNLFDSFDNRKIHKTKVPPLGGIAIFIGFVLSSIIATDGYSFYSLKYIIASVMLMFFIGLKDDLMVIGARKKIIVQVLAVVLLTTMGEISFTNLHGLFGVHEIPATVGFFVSLFVMLAIINAYNLIDGIDGLASGLAILASVVFGTWFFFAGKIQFAILSFALAGSIAGFFLYNVFGNSNKLFMGDTGSLIIGLVLAILVIKFNQFNVPKSTPFSISAAPSVSFALLAVPLMDTLRVIVIRLFKGKSPFSPDRNHTHHRLLELIPSHLSVTLILVGANALVIGLAFWFNHIAFNINLQFLLIFLTAVLICMVPSLILRSVKSGDKKSVYQYEISQE